MSLGSRQNKAITEAARQCAQAIKRFTPSSIKRSLVQAVRMQRPELAMVQIRLIAFRASEASKASLANGQLMEQLQGHYEQFLYTLKNSASEKHQKEMLRLFWDTYDRYAHASTRASSP